MGQYHKVYNLDKKELLHPHRFGDGLKLMEWGGSGGGTSTALAILLSNSNGRGGGDFRSEVDSTKIVGRWAGDRIVVQGDYAEEGDKAFISDDEREQYTDISIEVRKCLGSNP